MKRTGQPAADKTKVEKGALGRLTADSVVISWPVILQLIDDYSMGPSRVLDYGCGTGSFCRRMRSAGLHVDGFDASLSDIRSASKNSSRQIRYHGGDRSALKGMSGKYEVVTSLLGFQYFKDLEDHIPFLGDLLVERGLVVFSVFNPEFIENCFRKKTVVRSLSSGGRMKTARMEVKKGVLVDTYVRTRDRYRELFEKHGFEYLSSRYPQFTDEFVEKFDWKLPVDDAAFLVMAMRKKA